jgi:hypothetical protein
MVTVAKLFPNRDTSGRVNPNPKKAAPMPIKLNPRWLGHVRRGRAKLADRVTGDAVSGRVSRRDLIRRGTVVGLSAPLAGSILAGQGTGSPRSAKAGASGPVTLDSDVQAAQSGALAISAGGTGATTASGAFDNLAPAGKASQQLLVLLSSGYPGFVDDVVNVQAYGAQGNGVADDTTAIQAALNETPAGGTCFFPMTSSFYLITAPLLIPNRVNLRGPVYTRPSKPRDAAAPTPPIIMAQGKGPATAPGGYNNTTGWQAILTDQVYLADQTSYSFTAANGVSPCVVNIGAAAPSAGDPAIFLSGAPGGFSNNTVYYVVNPSGDAFRLAATAGGAPIGSTGMGTASGTIVTGPEPTASSGITINGLVIDGSGISPGSGDGHGIVLCSAACTIENCGVQNVPGNGFMFTDANWAQNEIAGAQDENGIYKSFAYQVGGDGINVSNVYNKLTDGYVEECIVDYNNVSGNTSGTTASVCINVENAADWHIVNNHVYACPGDAFHIYAASEARVIANQVDNYGQSSAKGTYYAFKIEPSPYGSTIVIGNEVVCDESAKLGAAGDSDYVYFWVQNSATEQINNVHFAGNSPRQIAAGTNPATSTAWEFNANGGTLNVFGFNAATMVEKPTSGYTISSAPVITGTVNFPDQSLSVKASTGAAGVSMDSSYTGGSWTWNVPDDGQLHRFQVFCTYYVSSAPQTGGGLSLAFTDPGGTPRTGQDIQAGSFTGTGLKTDTGAGSGPLCCQAGTAVTVTAAAQTAGQANFWLDILGI